ncbi:MAG: hypothetical protein ACK4XJ_08935 [Fimbriimonadaceae bacterium]
MNVLRLTMWGLMGVLLTLSPTVAQAQETEMARLAKQSDEVLSKMRQVQLLDYIVPLFLKKDQINKLLLEIEKARKAAQDQQKKEANQLAALRTKLDAALEGGFKDNKLPEKALLEEISGIFRTFEAERIAVMLKNVDQVTTVMEREMTEAQRKAAGNSLLPSMFPANVKIEELDEKRKFRFFVQFIFLDSEAYPVLVELAKKAT